MKTIDKCLDYNLRSGKVVNVAQMLEDWTGMYIASLEAGIDAFDTYDEISNETLNDLQKINSNLNVLEVLGYIDREEAENMRQLASDIRMQMLEKLNNKKEGEN